MHSVIESVTQGIIERSRESRAVYIQKMRDTLEQNPPKKRLSCGNLAHAYAACGEQDKQAIRLMASANLGIITSYNDMLSAHQPLETYPNLIKETARAVGSTAQVAAGVPAMCDGVTQGQPGMELSLLSRDVVAMAVAVGLSHNMFDGNLALGVCDKIVPGMLIGALQFGHIPTIFVPAGPMPSGIPNKEKAKVRQEFAAGKVDKDEMLAVESASYHSPGTCTFYGTANSNQLLMEMLGVQLAGASFVHPGTDLRDALTRAAVLRLIHCTQVADQYQPLYEVLTEKSLVNAIVALLATGGSTNHTLHLVAIAKAAGIELRWEDMDELSKVTPLLARIYPNGEADINHFQQAGGMAYLVHELRLGGLLNEDVVNIMGEGLYHYELCPSLDAKGEAVWQTPIVESSDCSVLASVAKPFDSEGGLRLVDGNLGKGIIKISAIAPEHRLVEAPCVVFESQEELIASFKAGELEKDFVAVVRFQGPCANGMPELHKMTPLLGQLQDKGYRVALVTDGRMSGASGKVPAVIHISPEAQNGGPLALLHHGDIIRMDANAGTVNALLEEDTLLSRVPAAPPAVTQNLGRNLFDSLRSTTSDAQHGASVFF